MRLLLNRTGNGGVRLHVTSRLQYNEQTGARLAQPQNVFISSAIESNIKMTAVKAVLDFVSVGVNRAVNALDWSEHGTVAYGAHNMAVIYDAEAGGIATHATHVLGACMRGSTQHPAHTMHVAS